MRSVFISGLSYRLGAVVPVFADLAIQEGSETFRLLEDKHVSTFAQFTAEPPLELFRECIESTLLSSSVRPHEVGAVILVTESFVDLFGGSLATGETEVRARRNRFLDLLQEMGVRDGLCLATTYGGSSNLLQALFISEALIGRSMIDNILLICADRHPQGVSRFMEQAIAMTGDGMATCCVTSSPRADAYEVEHIGLSRFQMNTGEQSFGRKVLEMYRTAKSAAGDCYEHLGRQPDSFNWLLMNNYNDVTCRVFAKLLGFSDGKVFRDNASRTGHVPACDIVVNLVDLERKVALEHGASVLIYANGPVSCGVASLSKVIPSAFPE